VVARVRRRLERLGLAGVAVTDEDADPLAHESQALAGLSEAAVRAGRRWAAGPGAARCGSAPTRTRRGSSATCRSTRTIPASTSTLPCTSLPATDGGSSGSASTCSARRSGSSACSGCATGGSPWPFSGRGRTGRHISCSRPTSSWSVSCRWCRARGSTYGRLVRFASAAAALLELRIAMR